MAADEAQDSFQSLTTDLQPFVCSHALLRFGSVGYNSPDGFRWDFAYVYETLKSAGEIRLRHKLVPELKRLCNESEPLSSSHLHLKAGRRLDALKSSAMKCVFVARLAVVVVTQ